MSLYPTMLAVNISSKHTLSLSYPFVTYHTNLLLVIIEVSNTFCVGLVLSRDKHFEWIESALSEAPRRLLSLVELETRFVSTPVLLNNSGCPFSDAQLLFCENILEGLLLFLGCKLLLLLLLEFIFFLQSILSPLSGNDIHSPFFIFTRHLQLEHIVLIHELFSPSSEFFDTFSSDSTSPSLLHIPSHNNLSQ